MKENYGQMLHVPDDGGMCLLKLFGLAKPQYRIPSKIKHRKKKK